MSTTDNRWLNVQDIAEILQIKDETVRRWIRRNDLPVLDLGGPRAGYRIRREDFDHFIWQRYRMRHQQAEDREYRTGYRESGHRRMALESVQIARPPVADGSANGSSVQDIRPSGNDRYLSLLSRVPGIAYTADHPPADPPARRITFVSAEFESIAGDSTARLRSDPYYWWELVFPDDLERVRDEIARSHDEHRRMVAEYRIAGVDNQTFWVRDESVPSEHMPGARTRWQGIILDITRQKKVEADLQARINQHAVLAKLGQHALQELDIDRLLDEAVEFVHSSLNVDFTKILELQPGGESLLLRAGVGWKPGMVKQATVSAGAQSQAGYTLLSNEPVIVTDLQSERRFNGPPLLHNNGVRSGISVIIAGNGKPWGVFGAHTTTSRTFSYEDVHFVQAVANIIASALRADVNNRPHGRWLSIHDVADSLRVKDETVRRWIRRGELAVVDLGSSRAGYRIHPADLDLFIQERYMQSEAQPV